MPTKPTIKRISTTNTKQEMLDAYNKLVLELEAKKENEIKASEKIEEKLTQSVLRIADELNSEAINRQLSELKLEFNSTLNSLSEKLDDEFNKYISIKKAISSKEKELQEIFEIQKNAQTLYALIEAEKIKKEEYLQEMEELKDELEFEINEKRTLWEKEKHQKEIEIKEKEKQETAQRNREIEEYNYKFQREQKLAYDKFESDKMALQKQLTELKERTESELAQRERQMAESEQELNELRAKSATFQTELSKAVEKAVKEATDRIIMEAKHKEELLVSKFNGERTALNTKIEVLEKSIKEQNELIAKYSVQLEKSYAQIQDIATKAVQGSSGKVSQGNQIQHNI